MRKDQHTLTVQYRNRHWLGLPLDRIPWTRTLAETTNLPNWKRSLGKLGFILWFGGLTGGLAGGLIGCQALQPTPTDTATPTATTATVTPETSPDPVASLPRLDGEATVLLKVKGGSITIKVDGKTAPITAGNFVDLVKKGVYTGTVFHRVVREPQPFVVQGGDPQSKDPNVPAGEYGTGGYVDPKTNQERFIPLEIWPQDAKAPVYSTPLQQAGVTVPPKLRHTRGAVAMARSQFPDSASSQFYFALGDVFFLDGDYAVFGYVTEGMDVVDQIQQGAVIDSAEVVSGYENLKLPKAEDSAAPSTATASPTAESTATPSPTP